MKDRREFSVGGSAEANFLAGLRTMSAGAEHLLAREVQLDRTPYLPGRDCAQHRMRPDEPLATETSTNEWRNNVDLLLRHSQCLRHSIARSHHPLRGLIERQFIAILFRHGCRRLHRVVMFKRGAIGGLVFHCGSSIGAVW